MKDGRIVEVTEVVGVEGSRVIFERYRPPHDTVFKTVSCGDTIVSPPWRPRCGSTTRAKVLDSLCSGRYRGGYKAVVTSVSWNLLSHDDGHTNGYTVARGGTYRVFSERSAGAFVVAF